MIMTMNVPVSEILKCQLLSVIYIGMSACKMVNRKEKQSLCLEIEYNLLFFVHFHPFEYVGRAENVYAAIKELVK